MKHNYNYKSNKIFEQIILIPIGGLGIRFKDNGYKRPKTLINIFGEPIIYHLINY